MRYALLIGLVVAGCGKREAEVGREATPAPTGREAAVAPVTKKPDESPPKKSPVPPPRNESIAHLVEAFYAAPPADRRAYVLDPAGYDDIAGWFYEGYRKPKKVGAKVLLVREGSTPQHLLVTVDMNTDGKKSTPEIPVRQTPSGYRIDWLAWVGDPVLTKEFRQLQDEMQDIVAAQEAGGRRLGELTAEAKTIGNDEAKGAKIIAEAKALTAAGVARTRRTKEIEAEALALAPRLKAAQDRALKAYRPE